MQADDTTPRYPTIRVDLRRAHGTCIRYGKGCRCTLCRAAMAELNRRSREKNPDRQAKYACRYRERHPEREAARHRLRYKTNPEERNALCRHHQARKLAAPGSHTAADVAAQYKRQKGRCFWCKAKVGKEYHVDHVVPITKDGSDGPENIVIACPHCNHRKSATHPMDFAGVLF